ncbi:MAG TPA: phosphatidylinositol-specific phospholipase C1-like protein [Rhizomicrobium sp.]|nr:phosphatidylinositol-specific phospholipase C1-like protein [Rhizomicrobium sp.]
MRNAVWVLLAAVLVGGPAVAQPTCNLSAPDAKSAGPDCARAWMDKNLHLNDILTVGTHNSYKKAVLEKIMALIHMASSKGNELDYAHVPLTEQLDDGARALEIDVVYDPEGGLYAHPAGAAMTGADLPPGYADKMAKPGFKVLHIQDIDFNSVCMTLVECLHEIKAWSDAHPDHIPILITMNAKDDEIPMPGSVTPLKFDTKAYDAWDAEILSVIPRKDIITPDDIQGTFPTLRDAVLAHGWPTLGEARGKFIFALDEEGDKITTYQGGRKSLEGRVMFVNAPDTSPLAAYLTLNEALTDTAHITADVQKGFLVRTRADADTVEARANDTRRREAALASGAQYVSTDYMRPDRRFGSYEVRLPHDAIALCNPQRHPERCAGLPVQGSPLYPR